MTVKLLSVLLLAPLLALNGCSHYAPGYDGWTREQVAQIKQSARERDGRYPHNDRSLLGVDYARFDPQGYRPALLGLATHCPSVPYAQSRQIDAVRIDTAVCLDSEGRVLRILQDLSSTDAPSLERLVALAGDEIRENYGNGVTVGLDNRFISKADYRQIYVTGSPTREQLLHYQQTRISDHIVSIRPDWRTKRQDPTLGQDHFYLDIRFQGYDAYVSEADSLRSQRLKDRLNAPD